MECEQVLSKVFAYLDGELTVWRSTALVRHLDDCPPCQERFEVESAAYVGFRRMMVQKCCETAPASLKFRIAESLGINVDPNSP